MKRKILTVLIVVTMIMATLTNTYAADGFFNVGMFETAYKLSKEADINLPFINVFTQGATYDKDVNHSGISFGSSTIDIDKKLEGVHLIVSAEDMVTIKGEVEHGIIYGSNIVIEGKISGDTILIADNIKILDGAIVEEDVVIVATNLEMAGTIKGNLIGAITDVTLSGIVEKDLRLDTVKVNLEEGSINGNIYIEVPAGGKESISSITEKYPNATIKEYEQVTEQKIDGEKIANIAFNGLKIVVIYTVIGLLLTRKEKNVISKATARFTENTAFGIITGTAMLMLIIAVPILLILLALIGLGVVAWPILIIYLALVLLSISISSFVVGMMLYQIIKNKLGKFKVVGLVGIFAGIYTLSQITAISFYVLATINILSMAIIMAYIFKKEEYGSDDVVEAKIVTDKKDK